MPAPPSLKACWQGEPGFSEARDALTWNKRLASARSPEAIVACRSAEDIAAAVRFAAARGLAVSPRGSGHHYEAAALRDNGLLLDLAGLDSVEIDTERRTARVGAGVTGGALIEQLAQAGLAFPVGHCADVALSGYILAGGFGWNAGEWGPACANVSAAELVLASGETVLASEQEHPDLLWAVRGGGPGFFAAVAAYHLDLHELPGAAFAWSTTFAAADAPLLADWLTAATAAAHPSAEIVALVHAEPHSGKPAVTVRAIAAGASEGEARARVAWFCSPPAEPIGETIKETLPFAELHKFSAMPHGKRVAADHVWSDAPPGELLRAVSHLADAPSKMSTINLVSFGGDGAVPTPPDFERGALSVGGGAGAGIYAMWDDAADDAANRAWVKDANQALESHRTGRYIGEADVMIGPQRLAECFAPEALERLRQLRAQYDPDGVFHTWP